MNVLKSGELILTTGGRCITSGCMQWVFRGAYTDTNKDEEKKDEKEPLYTPSRKAPCGSEFLGKK